MGKEFFDRAARIVASDLASAARIREEFFARRQNILRDAALVTARAIATGGKLLLCGLEGDGFISAQIAASFINGHEFERPPLPAIDLAGQAAPGSQGKNEAPARKLDALGKPGDVFLAVTSVGNRPEISRALEMARTLGLREIIFCAGGSSALASPLTLAVPTSRLPLAREILQTAAHLYCRLIDYYLFENAAFLFPQKDGESGA